MIAPPGPFVKPVMKVSRRPIKCKRIYPTAGRRLDGQPKMESGLQLGLVEQARFESGLQLGLVEQPGFESGLQPRLVEQARLESGLKPRLVEQAEAIKRRLVAGREACNAPEPRQGCSLPPVGLRSP